MSLPITFTPVSRERIPRVDQMMELAAMLPNNSVERSRLLNEASAFLILSSLIVAIAKTKVPQ